MDPMAVPLERVISSGPQFRSSMKACPLGSGCTIPGPPLNSGCCVLAMSTNISDLDMGLVHFSVMRLIFAMFTEKGAKYISVVIAAMPVFH